MVLVMDERRRLEVLSQKRIYSNTIQLALLAFSGCIWIIETAPLLCQNVCFDENRAEFDQLNHLINDEFANLEAVLFAKLDKLDKLEDFYEREWVNLAWMNLRVLRDAGFDFKPSERLENAWVEHRMQEILTIDPPRI